MDEDTRARIQALADQWRAESKQHIRSYSPNYTQGLQVGFGMCAGDLLALLRRYEEPITPQGRTDSEGVGHGDHDTDETGDRDLTRRGD